MRMWRGVAAVAASVAVWVSLTSGLGAQPAASGVGELRRAFESPPDDSRIMMRWWWFGPAVTKPQIERELRAMRAAGIGGVEVQPVYPVTLDDEVRGIRNLTFLSDEFLDALRFASNTAHDLGLRFDLTLGSGWPYGGPQVPISQAAGRLRIVRTPIPPGATDAPRPDIGAGEQLIATFAAPASSAATSSSAPSSSATSSANGARESIAFIASRTGMMVKRPAIGGEGFVIDHYDRAATDGYLSTVGERLLQAFEGRPPFSIFCDSLEVFGSDWTGDLLEQFQRRRGYDLRPLLPRLIDDKDSGAAGLRYDWGLMLTELLNEQFLAPMQAWAHRHNTKFRLQGYGMPPAALSSNAHADLSDGEGTEWKMLSSSRWASSANHLYGRPVTSSETWTWLHSPSFRATPLDIKAEADIHFVQGINQLIGHGWPADLSGAGPQADPRGPLNAATPQRGLASAARSSDYPGGRFYAAGAFNEKNPWWIVMPDVSRYLQRVSFLLRQGQPANDVAIYLPTSDGYASFTPGNVHLIDILRKRLGTDLMSGILEAGFNVDFIDDETLARAGSRYRAVILPEVEYMPLATVRTLDAFARGGGVVIATRRLPARAPGFRATDADHAEIARLAATFPLAQDDRKQLAEMLRSLLQPDLALNPAVADIGFVHRHTPDAEIYFVANTSNQRHRTAATFRVEGRRAEQWDPLTGRVSVPESSPSARSADKRGTTVSLDLPAYGSTVIVFPARTPPRQTMRPARVGGRAASAVAPAPLDISSGWQVTFTSAADGHTASRTMDRLRSWTDDESSRDFSGVAMYERTVTVPDALLKTGAPILLDFGEAKAVTPQPKARFQAWVEAPVREAVVVEVNGTRAGSLWSPPYALDVAALLKPGPNQLRLTVGNLAINYMASHAQPDYRLLNLRYGVRFEPQDMNNLQPLPAGLLGPITLGAAPRLGLRAPAAPSP